MSPQMLEDSREPTIGLYYGEGGTGKTSALAGMAHFGKILIVSAESGVKSRPLRSLGVPVDNIEIFPAAGEDITYESLEAEWVRVREALHADPEAYAGVGWDSITEIQKTLAEVERQKAVAKADRRGVERGEFVMDQDNRTTVNEQVRALVRKYRDLPCHFAMTALQRREVDDDSTVTLQPGVTPALQGDLIGWTDFVCYTSVAVVGDEEEYRGLFRPHGKYRGKDRLRATPKWLVDPSFDRVVGYVDGEFDKDDVTTDSVMEEARARRELAKAAEAEPAGSGS